MIANPFSTRFTTPGAFSFSSEQVDVRELLDLLLLETPRDHDSKVFQIVGPHGCGKTTLTISLAEILAEQGLTTRWLTIRGRLKSDSERVRSVRFENYLSDFPVHVQPDVLVIDGIESVNGVQHWCMLRQLRKRYRRVILTTHRPIWRVKLLATLSPTRQRFHELCKDLLGDAASDHDWLSRIDTAYQNANGNFREAFFELYDQFESRITNGTVAIAKTAKPSASSS